MKDSFLQKLCVGLCQPPVIHPRIIISYLPSQDYFSRLGFFLFLLVQLVDFCVFYTRDKTGVK